MYVKDFQTSCVGKKQNLIIYSYNFLVLYEDNENIGSIFIEKCFFHSSYFDINIIIFKNKMELQQLHK